MPARPQNNLISTAREWNGVCHPSDCERKPVKNPYVLLSQKQEEVSRVRKEIQALLIVIPLLDDDVPKWEEVRASLSNFHIPRQKTTRDSMRELEVYFPFVKNLPLEQETDV
jgi:hypothetical protein